MGSGGSEGPSRWPKATSPLQELEVGAHRVPYLLVYYTRRYGILWAPTSSFCGGLVAFSHLEGPSGPLDICIGRDHWVAMSITVSGSDADNPLNCLHHSQTPCLSPILHYLLTHSCLPTIFHYLLTHSCGYLDLQHGSNVKNVTEGRRGGTAWDWGFE